MIRTTARDRLEFFACHQRGDTYPCIADAFRVSAECVRYWCRRLRAGGSHLTTYRLQPHALLESFDPRLGVWILEIRRQHPRRGPNRIRYCLEQQYGGETNHWPSDATIGRFLHQFPEFHRRRRQVAPSQRPQEATEVHQCWQLDFKVGIKLADGTRVTLHTLRDPVGEACLAAQVFPAGKVGTSLPKVTWQEARTTLRRAFTCWRTLPDIVQTDHESDLRGLPQDAFPTEFTLWLAGLGIVHRFIRPGCPTDNAEIERCQRTINDYAIIGNEHEPMAQLQQVLDDAVHDLAFDLISHADGCHGLTPVQAHPELLQSRRAYDPTWERALFDVGRVDAYLATLRLQRKVSKTGQISIGQQHEYYSVGRRYAGHEVIVRFDPADRSYVFYDEAAPDTEIGRKPARHLTADELLCEPDSLTQTGPQQLSLFPLP